jgi:hypothetical protein
MYTEWSDRVFMATPVLLLATTSMVTGGVPDLYHGRIVAHTPAAVDLLARAQECGDDHVAVRDSERKCGQDRH